MGFSVLGLHHRAHMLFDSGGLKAARRTLRQRTRADRPSSRKPNFPERAVALSVVHAGAQLMAEVLQQIIDSLNVGDQQFSSCPIFRVRGVMQCSDHL